MPWRGRSAERFSLKSDVGWRSSKDACYLRIRISAGFRFSKRPSIAVCGRRRRRWRCWRDKRESHDCVALRRVCIFEFFQYLALEIVRIHLHPACGDLCLSSALKAKLADPQAAFREDGWPECAAGDRPRRVEVAHSGVRVERRAGLVVGEGFELFFGVLV